MGSRLATLLRFLRIHLRRAAMVLNASKSQENAHFHRIVWPGLLGVQHRSVWLGFKDSHTQDNLTIVTSRCESRVVQTCPVCAGKL